MNSYEELLKEKSLDGLLREVRQENIKREAALVKVDSKKRNGEYDDGLAAIVGEELYSQRYGNFSEAIKIISEQLHFWDKI